RATGLVTDAELTDTTSAAFYAHIGDPGDPEKIAAEFVDRGNIDIAMGGGAAQFIPATKGGDRQDTRDLLLELRGNGFDIVRTRTTQASPSASPEVTAGQNRQSLCAVMRPLGE